MKDCCLNKAEARKNGMFEGPVGDHWFHDKAPCKGWPAKQHPWDSLFETITNTLIGYIVSLLCYAWVINPMFHLHTETKQNLGIVAVFTAFSLVRQFGIRRLFNGKSPYAWIVERIRNERSGSL